MNKIICLILFLFSWSLNSFGAFLTFINESAFPVEIFFYHKTEQGINLQIEFLDFKKNEIKYEYCEDHISNISFSFVASPEKNGFKKLDFFSCSTNEYYLKDITKELKNSKTNYYNINEFFKLNNKNYTLSILINNAKV